MSTKGWAAVAAVVLALLICLPVVVVLAAFSGAGPERVGGRAQFAWW